MKSNLQEQEAAKAAAKRLYQKVNFSGGPLQSYQISSLLTDTYEYLNIPFKPTSQNVKSYTEILDANRDGQVTLSDLQTLAVQYLCGPGVLSTNLNTKTQSYETSSAHTNVYTTNTTNITNTVPKTQIYDTSNQIPTYTTNQTNAYTSSLKVTTQEGSGYLNNQNWQPLKPGSNTPSNSTQSYTTQPTQPEYNEQTLHYLSISKQIFDRYADQHYTITTPVVPNVLSETYEVLGRKGYKPSEEDVKVWMKLCDGNGDGHVQYQEYSYFIIRSLERTGYQIYK